MPTSGFFLSVYRNACHGDCTNGGLSSIHTEIFVCRDGKLITAPSPWTEADAIERGVPVFVVGKKGNRFNFTPKHETRWTMAGGNFAYCCDSRCPDHPISIHDRIE